VKKIMGQVGKNAEELFMAYGGACHAAQLLEHSFRLLLISQRTAEGQSLSKSEVVHSIETETMCKNLMSLFHILVKREYLTDKEHKIIVNAIRQRNYLIHECFKPNRHNLLTVNGRRKILQEIREIREKLNFAREIIESLAEKYLVEFGLTMEIIIQKAEILYEDDDQDYGFLVH
jgi:hypothetical protein